jgi:hypothetical protein
MSTYVGTGVRGGWGCRKRRRERKKHRDRYQQREID